MASALIRVHDASCTGSANGFRCSSLCCGHLTVARRADISPVPSLRYVNLCFSIGAFVDWWFFSEIYILPTKQALKQFPTKGKVIVTQIYGDAATCRSNSENKSIKDNSQASTQTRATFVTQDTRSILMCCFFTQDPPPSPQ